MTIWRLHVNINGGDCADVFFDNSVMVIGWAVDEQYLKKIALAIGQNICGRH